MLRHRLLDLCLAIPARCRAAGFALAALLAVHLPADTAQAVGTGGAKQSAAGNGLPVRPDGAFHRLDPRKDFSERVIDTALFPLKIGAYALDKRLPNGRAFMIVGDRILLASGSGGFAEIDMREAAPAIRTLPLRIDLQEERLLDFAAGRGFVDFYLLRILDLASVNEGRQFAVSYTRWNPARKCVSLFVAVNDLPADWSAIDAKGWRTVFESQPCLPLRLDGTSLFAGHQAGGRILETKPGKLILTTGDFEYDGVNRTPIYPQDRTSDYGKVFEIDLASGTREIRSIGHRNPQGLFMDAGGRLWSTEHGPHGGDELNLLAPGGNYGWPFMTFGVNYEGGAWPLSARQGRHDDPAYRAPKYAWVPSLGISDLIAVKNFGPEWEGDLLVASLRGEQLRRLRLEGESIVSDEPIGLDDRMRDIGQLADGRIVLWTDSDKLLILKRDLADGAELDRRIAALSDNVRAVVQACRQCHSLRNGGANGKIPLAGIFGRDIGSSDPELYSASLKVAPGAWDDGKLDSFLANPKRWAPGTTMQFPGIEDKHVRSGVITFLRMLK